MDKVRLLPNTKNSVLWRRRHVQQKLHEASNTIDKVAVQRRAIDRRLRGVEILPKMEAGAILSLPGGNGIDAEDSAEVESSEH